MKIADEAELAGRSAVITGAASGMGLAFARRFAELGMRVAMADVEADVLVRVVDELGAAGLDVYGEVCDVTDAGANQRLIDGALGRFGSIDVLCLNAGVAAGGAIGDLTANDWRWTLDVNLHGVVHGLRAALPAMTAANAGRIIFTASVLGHMPTGGLAPYVASKYAVVGIAETLEAELRAAGSGLKVSCLCPGIIKTGIAESERNRPESAVDEAEVDPDTETLRGMAKQIFEAGHDPAMVADQLVDAIVADQFWVFTDDDFHSEITRRHSEIGARSNPGSGLGLLAGVVHELDDADG